MTCDNCHGKGIVFPDDLETQMELRDGESQKDYAARIRHLATDSYCKCLSGQRLFWLMSKVSQTVDKIEAKMNSIFEEE